MVVVSSSASPWWCLDTAVNTLAQGGQSKAGQGVTSPPFPLGYQSTPGQKGEAEPKTDRIPVPLGASVECIGVKAFPVAIFNEAAL